MATRPFTLRLGVKDAEVARKALRNLGTEGKSALRKLERAAKKADRETSQLGRTLSTTARKLGDFRTALRATSASLTPSRRERRDGRHPISTG